MVTKKKVVLCVRCHEPLTTFMAYIPGQGDCCMKCFTAYAQEEDNLLVTRTKQPQH